LKTLGYLAPDVRCLVSDFQLVTQAWQQRHECTPADVLEWREQILDTVDLARKRGALDQQAYAAEVIQMCRTWAGLAARVRG
jgi:hypothetical protein